MSGLIGVLIGAMIVFVGNKINATRLENKEERKDRIYDLMKEIDTLVLLNQKIQEILLKREVHLEIYNYQSFDSFDDCLITIDDYVYLQSFCAQNHFYLPTFLVEEFFASINQRKIVLNPDEIQRLGAYPYKGGRIVLENFSEDIISCAEDRKIELKQLRGR